MHDLCERAYSYSVVSRDSRWNLRPGVPRVRLDTLQRLTSSRYPTTDMLVPATPLYSRLQTTPQFNAVSHSSQFALA